MSFKVFLARCLAGVRTLGSKL